ncbi:hypothetical protein V9J15_05180 [Candidatus Liberibacter africanus]|uniref:CLIBASIA_04065 family virulence factor n=1 Tax=Liberibacter africanus TaxID=34020 RepID=UPI0011DDFD18|nr:hypothetical protein [Candidatus Liberibacter africanus]
MRLKKCNSGSFFIVTAVLLSSFLSIADVLLDFMAVMQTNYMLRDIMHSVVYQIHINDLYEGNSKYYMRTIGQGGEGRIAILTGEKEVEAVRKRIKQFFYVNDFSDLLSKENIDSAINNASIVIKKKSESPLEFHVTIDMVMDVELKGFFLKILSQFWGRNSNSKSSVKIFSQKKISYKQEPSIMGIFFTWESDLPVFAMNAGAGVYGLVSNTQKKILISNELQNNFSKYSFIKDIILNEVIEYIPLCIAPYNFSGISYWYKGFFQYDKNGESSSSRSSYLVNRIYRTRWTNISNITKSSFDDLFFKEPGYVTNSLLLRERINPCFPENGKQQRNMLIVAMGGELTTGYLTNQIIMNQMSQACFDIHVDPPPKYKNYDKKHNVVSIGIEPDMTTRNILKKCANSTSSKYYEIDDVSKINEFKKDGKTYPMIREIAKHIKKLVSDNFTVTILND